MEKGGPAARSFGYPAGGPENGPARH